MASNQIDTKPKTLFAYEALIQRLDGKEPNCSGCHRSDWLVETYLAAVPAAHKFEHPPWNEQDPHVFPYLVVTCKYCGGTMFFNLLTLGLGHLFDIDSSREVNS